MTVPAPPTVTRSVTRPVLAQVASCFLVIDATCSGVFGGAGGGAPALPEPPAPVGGCAGTETVVNVWSGPAESPAALAAITR